MPQTQTQLMKPMCVLSQLEKVLIPCKSFFVYWNALSLCSGLMASLPLGSLAVSSQWSQPRPEMFTLSAGGIIIQPSGLLLLSLYRTQSARGDSVCHLCLVALEYWLNCHLQTHLLETCSNHSPQSDMQPLLFRARSFPCKGGNEHGLWFAGWTE